MEPNVFIPTNYTDAGKILGLFYPRNALEAVTLGGSANPTYFIELSVQSNCHNFFVCNGCRSRMRILSFWNPRLQLIYIYSYLFDLA